METTATFQLTQRLRIVRRSCLCTQYESGWWWVQISHISQKMWLMKTHTRMHTYSHATYGTLYLSNIQGCWCVYVLERIFPIISRVIHVCVVLLQLTRKKCVTVCWKSHYNQNQNILKQQVVTLLDAISSHTQQWARAYTHTQKYIVHYSILYIQREINLWHLSASCLEASSATFPAFYASHRPLCLRDMSVNDAPWLSVLLWLWLLAPIEQICAEETSDLRLPRSDWLADVVKVTEKLSLSWFTGHFKNSLGADDYVEQIQNLYEEPKVFK